jgi:hypothetical protein
MRYVNVGVWDTPGLLDRLKAHAKAKMLSAAQIAAMLSAEFKIPITRNMVCGRVWRLGLSVRPRPKSRPKQAPSNVVPFVPKAKHDPNEPQPLGDVPCGCRWLHGDASDRNFCGAPTTSILTSWCHHHAARVWAPQPKLTYGKPKRFTASGVPIY